MSAGKFLAGFIVGGALGAVAGILLAPQEGQKTREMIGDTTKELSEKTDKTVKEIQEKAEFVCSDLQKRGEEIMGKVQDLINKQKNSPEEA